MGHAHLANKIAAGCSLFCVQAFPVPLKNSTSEVNPSLAMYIGYALHLSAMSHSHGSIGSILFLRSPFHINVVALFTYLWTMQIFVRL
jgi:hypothetical protein